MCFSTYVPNNTPLKIQNHILDIKHQCIITSSPLTQTKHHQERIKIFTLVYSLTNTVSAVVNGHELAAFPRGVCAVSQHKNKLNVLLNIGDVTH